LGADSVAAGDDGGGAAAGLWEGAAGVRWEKMRVYRSGLALTCAEFGSFAGVLCFVGLLDRHGAQGRFAMTGRMGFVRG
jgi:hypothetical protein